MKSLRSYLLFIVFAASAFATAGQERTLQRETESPGAEALEKRADDLRKSNSSASRAQAIAAYEEALDAWKRVGNSTGQVRTLLALGQLYDYSARGDDALQVFGDALEILGSAGDLESRARALYGIGKARAARYETAEALAAFGESLRIREQSGQIFEQALVLHNMAAAQWAVADNEAALENYRRALALRREIDDKPGIAYTYYGIAITHWSAGERQFALDACQQSASIWRDLKNHFGLANVRNSMGLLYAELGDVARAREAYAEALSLWKMAGSATMSAYTDNNLGMVNAAAGNYIAAARRYGQALPVLREAGDQRGVAYVLHNQADLAVLRGKPEDAFPLYRESLEIKRKIGDRFGEAITLERMAEAERVAQRPGAALKGFERALRLHRETGNKAGESMALWGLARSRVALGEPEPAIARFLEAIALAESARGAIANEDLRVTYFATVQDLYGEAIDALFLQAGRSHDAKWLEDALELAERSRARVFLDSLSAASGSVREEEGREARSLAASGRRRSARMRAVAQGIQRLASVPGNEEELLRARTQLDALVRDWQDALAARNRGGDDLAARWWPPDDLLAYVRERALDGDTEILAFRLGEARSLVWRVSREAIHAEALPGRAVLERYAGRYLQWVNAYAPSTEDTDLVARQLRLQQAAKSFGDAPGELSWLLLAKILKDCTAKRLVVIPDGILHAVPLAALPQPYNPGEAMLAKWEIIRAPSASALAALREERPGRATGGVAVVADPVYHASDTRLAGKPRALAAELLVAGEANLPGFQLPVPLLPRLRFTLEEAKAIQEFSSLPVNTYAGFDADLNTLSRDEIREARVLHLGTHAWADNRTPEASGIALSLLDAEGNPRDGYLRLFEIYELRLRADLVVLGGCQTALGKSWRGEGVESLARGFLHAGAARVLATLWTVDDSASAALMRGFYGRYLSEGMPASAALRSAQRELARDQRYRHPYYWAAYVLEGDWH